MPRAARHGGPRRAAEHRAAGARSPSACTREIRDLEHEIWDLAGEEFVIGSPQQLGEVLFDKLGLSSKRRGKTGFSTDARVLQAIRDEHEIVPKIERWRELNQLSKTYLDVLPAAGRRERAPAHDVHPGRARRPAGWRRPNPNVQNVPIRTPLGREIRGCFEAAPGNVLVSADYSQVELRDPRPHRRRARAQGDLRARRGRAHGDRLAVFGRPPEQLDKGHRSKAKMINYGIVYGLSDYGLADRLNIPREEAKEIIDAYLGTSPGSPRTSQRTIEEATETGYMTTLFGRRRHIPELKARNWGVRSLGERLAVNTPIQGTAADVMKLAMIGAARALDDEGLRDAADPHDPRRAALRGPARGGRRGQGARRARDGRAVGRRAAARGRRRRRRDLARGQVAAAPADEGRALSGGRAATPRPARAAASGAGPAGAHRELRRRDGAGAAQGPVHHAPGVHDAQDAVHQRPAVDAPDRALRARSSQRNFHACRAENAP